MEVSKQQEEFKKDLATALVKAWESKDFKNKLIASPKEAIESVTGRPFNIKEDVNFVVSDQSKENTFYLNIPSKPDVENIELTEEQLELVAGGSIGWGDLYNGALEVVDALSDGDWGGAVVAGGELIDAAIK